MKNGIHLKRVGQVTMPTDWGEFDMLAYAKTESEQMPHIVMAHPEMDVHKPVMVRIHSECITGDLFHSQRCDCGPQLHEAMKRVFEAKGALLYLRQEGRGIGIINKIKAYNQQDRGHDTVEANLVLGFEADQRDYGIAIQILDDIGISDIRLLTNNPLKLSAIEKSHINIIERIPLIISPNKNNIKYLKTKQDSMGHLFKING